MTKESNDERLQRQIESMQHVRSAVTAARANDRLVLDTVACEMIAHGIAILTGCDIQSARDGAIDLYKKLGEQIIAAIEAGDAGLRDRRSLS